MAKKPKEFPPLPSSQGSPGASGEWKEAWSKIAAENRKAMNRYMKELGEDPETEMDTALFNPESAMETFTETMGGLSRHLEKEQTFPLGIIEEECFS